MASGTAVMTVCLSVDTSYVCSLEQKTNKDSQASLGMVAHTCNPNTCKAYGEGEGRGGGRERGGGGRKGGGREWIVSISKLENPVK